MFVLLVILIQPAISDAPSAKAQRFDDYASCYQQSSGVTDATERVPFRQNAIGVVTVIKTLIWSLLTLEIFRTLFKSFTASNCIVANPLFLLLIHFFATANSLAMDGCTLISGGFAERITFTGSCDVSIDGALFVDIHTDGYSGGAVYLNDLLIALSMAFTIFDGCEGGNQGGALYASNFDLRINRTCFSYCYCPGDGKHIRGIVHSAGASVLGDCTFFASFRRADSASPTAGDAVGLQSSSGVYYFRDENHTRSDALSSACAAVDCDYDACTVNRQFSTFVDCRENYVLWLYAKTGSADAIGYTNFISNSLYEGVICSSDSGCPVVHCVFQGNSQGVTLCANQFGDPFVIVNCVFDHEPSGSWSSSGTGNAFGVTTETVAVPVMPCVVTPPPPAESATFTSAVASGAGRRRRIITLGVFLYFYN
jgi:hypothetical protein